MSISNLVKGLMLVALAIGAVSNGAKAMDQAETRSLTAREKVLFNDLACKAFTRIYGNSVNIDQGLCRTRSSFKISENDPKYGTYIFGMLQYSKFENKDCNMQIKNDEITSVDCSDE